MPQWQQGLQSVVLEGGASERGVTWLAILLSDRSDDSWRKDARGVLASLDGLNRSQQRAIATAMSSTFTLWQVLAPDPMPPQQAPPSS